MHVFTDKASNDANINWIVNLREYNQGDENANPEE